MLRWLISEDQGLCRLFNANILIIILLFSTTLSLVPYSSYSEFVCIFQLFFFPSLLSFSFIFLCVICSTCFVLYSVYAPSTTQSFSEIFLNSVLPEHSRPLLRYFKPFGLFGPQFLQPIVILSIYSWQTKVALPLRKVRRTLCVSYLW